MTVLASTLKDLKKDLAESINKPAEEEKKDNDVPPTPGRGYDIRRGRRQGRGWNGRRYMNVQGHHCGQYGHIMRACPHISQAHPHASYTAPTPYIQPPIPGRTDANGGYCHERDLTTRT